MTTTINLKIKSRDSFDTEIIEIVSAIKKINSVGFQYFYESEEGKVELSFAKNSFKMSRTGESSVKIYFLENGTGEFRLDAYGLKETWIIRNAKKIHATEKIEVFYEMYQGDERINSLSIEICEEI